MKQIFTTLGLILTVTLPSHSQAKTAHSPAKSSSKLIEKILSQNWIKDDEWTDKERREYTHYDDGKTASSATFSWDGETEAWTGNIKEEFTYDAKGNTTSTTDYQWNGTSWKPKEKNEYQYSSIGKLILTEDFEYINNKWDNTKKKEYVYDAQFNLTRETSSRMEKGA